MQGVKCRMKLRKVSFICGHTTRMITALYNNAFWLDKNFKLRGEKSSLDSKLETRSKSCIAQFHSVSAFPILGVVLVFVFLFTHSLTSLYIVIDTYGLKNGMRVGPMDSNRPFTLDRPSVRCYSVDIDPVRPSVRPTGFHRCCILGSHPIFLVQYIFLPSSVVSFFPMFF